jgi:glc operon protein GlcG
VSTTIGCGHVVDLVIGNQRPFAVHFNFVMVANHATLGRATVHEVAARTLAVISSELPAPNRHRHHHRRRRTEPPVGLEAAKKVMAAAEAEAAKNNWAMAIIILDSTGHPVMLHKFDNTQYGSIGAAEDKARSALYYRRPTKVFEDLVAQGGIGLRTLALRNASPLEGGIPLIVDGKIIGAIGVSGAASSQDGQVAKAGADAAK